MKVKHLLAILGVIVITISIFYFTSQKEMPTDSHQKPASPKLIYTITGENTASKLKEPAYALADNDGKVFVSDTGNHRIAVFNRKGKLLFDFGGPKSTQPLQHPYGIGLLKDSVLVADTALGALYEYNLEGKYLRNWLAGISIHQPAGIFITLDQTVYVSDLAGKQILVFSAQGQFLRSVKLPNVSLGAPQGLAVNKDGAIWVADGANYNVKLIKQNGELLTVFDGGPKWTLSTPKGLAIDSQERIYITDTLSNTIRIFAQDGADITAFGPIDDKQSAFRLPLGISIDSEGEIFVADQGNNKIQVWGW